MTICPVCGNWHDAGEDCGRCRIRGKTDHVETLERLADAQHAIWSHWMRWFFENDTEENRRRWQRQMNTSYARLSEQERDSDRRVVSKFVEPVICAMLKELEGVEEVEAWNKQLRHEVAVLREHLDPDAESLGDVVLRLEARIDAALAEVTHARKLYTEQGTKFDVDGLLIQLDLVLRGEN